MVVTFPSCWGCCEDKTEMRRYKNRYLYIRTWISICLGLFINFSISKRSSPKLDFASCDDKRNPSLNIYSSRDK